jgi:hypothetical protein
MRPRFAGVMKCKLFNNLMCNTVSTGRVYALEPRPAILSFILKSLTKNAADHGGRARGLRHEQSSLARTLGSWVWIPLEGMDVCVRLFCV